MEAVEQVVALKKRRIRLYEPEKERARKARYRLAHPEYERNKKARAVAKNPERFLELARARSERWRTQHPGAQAAATARWAAKNPGYNAQKIREKRLDPTYVARERERYKEYYSSKAEQLREKSRQWKAQNPEKTKEKRSDWWNRNPGARNFARMMYYIRKIKALPAWADLKAIRAVYDAAKAKTLSTGVEHHVDHIVPLQSEIVCGLHVSKNLQVLTADANRRKRNFLQE